MLTHADVDMISVLKSDNLDVRSWDKRRPMHTRQGSNEGTTVVSLAYIKVAILIISPKRRRATVELSKASG